MSSLISFSLIQTYIHIMVNLPNLLNSFGTPFINIDPLLTIPQSYIDNLEIINQCNYRTLFATYHKSDNLVNYLKTYPHRTVSIPEQVHEVRMSKYERPQDMLIEYGSRITNVASVSPSKDDIYNAHPDINFMFMIDFSEKVHDNIRKITDNGHYVRVYHNVLGDYHVWLNHPLFTFVPMDENLMGLFLNNPFIDLSDCMDIYPKGLNIISKNKVSMFQTGDATPFNGSLELHNKVNSSDISDKKNTNDTNDMYNLHEEISRLNSKVESLEQQIQVQSEMITKLLETS
jgi:hypothetical protein